MRLTLRTLLAYLDDTLEPAQAKIIGQKVAESEVARELIERIKQVTRRRRLAAPPATGPGSKLDTNAVAEYIDNVLPDDQIAEVEETFLNSDVHLAEVASCHQILTHFLGQPSQVPPTARQRMVGLVKGRESVVRRPSRPSEDRDADGQGTAELPDEADEALLLGMPSYLRRQNGARRLMPVAVVLGLVVLLLVAVWQIVPRGSSPVALNSSRPATHSESGPAAVVPDRATPPDTSPATRKETPKETPKEDPKVKQPIHDAPATDKPSKERRPIGKYVVAADGPAPSLLLQKASAGKEKDVWTRVKPDAAISTTDALVSLPGYRSEVRLDSNASLTLWGNLPDFLPLAVLESSAVLHVPTDDCDIDCTLNQGLIVIANKKPLGKVKARVRFQDEIWEVTLDDGGAIGLSLYGEYTGRIPFKSDGSGEGPLVVLDVFGLQGSVEVKVNPYHSFALPVAAYFSWDNTGPRTLSPRPLAADAIRWYSDKQLPDTAQVKSVVTAMKDLSKRLGDKAPAIGLAEIRIDAKGATLALSVFALPSIDDVKGMDVKDMIACLSDKDRQDVRYFASQTLRHWIAIPTDAWFMVTDKSIASLRAEEVPEAVLTKLKGLKDKILGRDQFLEELAEALNREEAKKFQERILNIAHTDNDMRLYKALQKPYSAAQADAIMKMLHGFSREDWGKKDTYEWLIERLESKEIALRELAFLQLWSHVPDAAKLPYRPGDPEDARQAGVAKWKALLDSGGLPPKPMAK